ncbi:allantoinase AllB [Micrococcoides hystricis]|uniref:allantoinase n=1 Tax=Micrococcoides hystricis TaxID=1572761 RepID=A0ABV6PCM3_9MICC
MTTTYDLLVYGQNVLTENGLGPAQVAVKDGRIAAIEALVDGDPTLGTDAATVRRLGDDEVLIPGLVDTHVHINEPGRTPWEGFDTATKAAAAGGFTTLIDMPLNSVPSTVDMDALELKTGIAQEKSFVDVGFWGGAVPDNADQLAPLHQAGVFGFKSFMVNSGVEEFQHLNTEQLKQAMADIPELDGMIILHAEDPDTIDAAPEPDGRSYAAYLASRPQEAELAAIDTVLDGARSTGVKTHLLHLAAGDAVAKLAAAKAEGLPLTVETCPHYLVLKAEDIPDGATAYKCAPPIREGAVQEQLWDGLKDGTIDAIVSDHSPSTLDLKDLEGGDFGAAWGGIASLQLGLSLIWTEAKKRGFSIADVVRWMGTNPAEIVGLQRKGKLAVGYDADLVVFAPEETFVVDAEKLHHKNPVTPYQDQELSGVVHTTYVRGAEVDFQTPKGAILTKGNN